MKSVIRKTTFTIFLLFLSVVVSFSQSATCPELVETALNAVENNCRDLGRNEACYGYNLVQASFINEVPEDFFSQVSDKTALAELATVQTSALNSTNGQWGVALLNLQANLPNTIPGQNVTFVLMGDVTVENAVAPENTFVPIDGIEISLAVDSANLRSGAGLNFNVVAGLRRGEMVLADGLSADGEWLRVVKDERPAWLNRSLVTENPEIETLPVLSNELHTPMQAFYLRTGLGQPECLEAPEDMLLVQGPEDIQIEITVNGAQVELGSTGIFRTIEDDGVSFLEITVLDGVFEVDGTEIRTGQRSRLCLGDADSRGLDGESNDLVVTCEPSYPENVPNFGADWCKMETIPSAVLNYPIEIVCPGESIVSTSATSGGQGNASQSQLPTVSCVNFTLISPLSAVNSGDHTFSWTGVEGENIRYDLVFYNNDGQEVNVFSTSESSYSLNLGAQTATGGGFAWEVRAYSNGQYACVTARSPELVRTAELDGVGSQGSNPTGSGFTATLSGCSMNPFMNWVATATFSNASNGGLVSLTGTRGSASPSTTTNFAIGPSGNVSIVDSVSLTNIVITDVDTGQSINLGNCP